MDSETAEKLTNLGNTKKKRKNLVIILTVSASLLGACAASLWLFPSLQVQGRFVYRNVRRHLARKVRSYLPPLSFIGPYVEAWQRINAKIEHLQQVDIENAHLRLANANLNLRMETRAFDQGSKAGKRATRQKEIKLTQETGNKVGRTLASIDYRPPEKMDSAQLYTLAVGYFKTGENEKAAVILSHLLNQVHLEAGQTSYRTAKNVLMTGIAWYRVENYSLADSYFNELLRNSQGDSQDDKAETNRRYSAQARLWKALVAEKTSKKMKAQFWMKELLDHHPRSNEAEWINAPK